MFTFTLKKKTCLNSSPRPRGAARPGVRFRKVSVRPAISRLLLVAVLATVVWPVQPAAAIEFVTREAFTVEKSSYKDYPYRVLFEKLHGSTGVEKRKIRNIIILKQVFDPEISQRAIIAGTKFEASYGVIKAISADRLRLWQPESDSFKDFQVGIDRIPVENKHDYPVSAANISNFASVVHILDNRVYKVEISFALPAPEKLKVDRQGANNRVSWQQPENVQAPSGYLVFVNDKLFKTVTATAVEVPRSREQADEFFVKAVYTHQKGRIASTASPTLYDAASAKEIEKRQQAGEVYRQFTAALGRSDQPAARQLLENNQQLLADFLSPDRQAHILTAGAFFKALDEGDRLAALRPETAGNLADARTAFQRAADEAGRLPAEFMASEVARSRLEQNAGETARLTTHLQKEQARQTLAQISADLRPGRWEQARKHLYQQQAFLHAHLDQEERAGVAALAGFFQSIEKGDLSAGIQPPAARHLEAAMQSYRQAERESRTLPGNLDAGFIARERIKTTANRQAALASAEQARLATLTWEKLVVDLNPSGWQNARTTLYENQSSLFAHLPPDNKAAMAILVDFFTSLDEGDRLAASQPATMEHLDTAAMYYRRAAQKAETLPDKLDVGFITRLKSSEIKTATARLQAKLSQQESEQLFDQITAALDTGQWRNARGLLYAKQDLLTRHLDDRRKSDCLTLIGIFHDLDEGDRLAGMEPPAMQNLDAALDFYRQAVAKGQTLPKNLDTGLIARQKIRAVVARKDQLFKGAQETGARRAYDQVVATLNPTDWKKARPLLVQNEDLFAAHLDANRKAVVARLLTFFQLIQDGDRLSAQTPVTRDNLNMALSSYRLADQKTRDLADVADLTFLTALKIETNGEQQAGLETRAKQAGAREIYQAIEATLTPTGWEAGMRLCLDKLPPVVEDLELGTQSSARLLIAFFENIQAGDRLRSQRPETDSNLAKARGHYQQAGKNAEALDGSPDVLFIARERFEAINIQRADLVKRQQALMAAQQVPVPAPAPRQAPPPLPSPPPAPAATATTTFDASVDAKTALKQAMKAFSAQNYDLSLKYFNMVYSKQIRQLRKAGKKQSFAVLGVSPNFRAEILFLVQLDLLKERSIGDADMVRDGLMDMANDVEAGSGVWSIVKERKRSKISKHIDRYPF